MKRLLMLVLMAVAMVAGGCTSKPLSPEEIAAERDRQLQMITRIYQGKTTQDVLLAADRVFRLADDDYSVNHSPTSIQAQRRWMLYLVISAAFGTDTWNISTEPVEGGVKVMAMHSAQNSSVSGLPLPTAGGDTSVSTMTSPSMQFMTNQPAIYQLFYARLDHLLGVSPDWPTCKDATKQYKDGSLGPLCMVATDRTPDGRTAVQRKPRSEKTQKREK